MSRQQQQKLAMFDRQCNWLHQQSLTLVLADALAMALGQPRPAAMQAKLQEMHTRAMQFKREFDAWQEAHHE